MVDTEPLAQQIWSRILAGYGYDLDDEVYARVVGRRTAESARIIQQAYHLPLSPEQLADLKSTMWEARWRQGVPPRPGLFILHAEIARRNIPWAVATSSPRDYAEHILRGLSLWPTHGAIAAGDEVANGKPAPDIYLLAARHLAVDPSSCLVLEDSVPGGRAAQSAGMTLAAVPFGFTSSSDFDFAPFIFNSLGEVADTLSALFS